MDKKELTAIEKQRLARLQEELERIVTLLIKEYNPQKIILFGSLVDESIHEWSDIDLVVIKDSNKTFYERLEEVGLLLLPEVAANIFVYTPEEIERSIEKSFFIRKEILEKGRVLYDAHKWVV